jgi:hypothetical protein
MSCYQEGSWSVIFMNIDINAEIAEKIVGWKVDREQRLYRDLNQPEGVFKTPPDFLARTSDHEFLQKTMKSRGWELNVVRSPTAEEIARNLRDGTADFENQVGQMFTVSYRCGDQSFQTSQSDERTAVCIAALKAYGLQIAHDQ